ncbi:MAG: hypothetical protein EZS28_053412, partial [Streblomastix strix]
MQNIGPGAPEFDKYDKTKDNKLLYTQLNEPQHQRSNTFSQVTPHFTQSQYRQYQQLPSSRPDKLTSNKLGDDLLDLNKFPNSRSPMEQQIEDEDDDKDNDDDDNNELELDKVVQKEKEKIEREKEKEKE